MVKKTSPNKTKKVTLSKRVVLIKQAATKAQPAQEIKNLTTKVNPFIIATGAGLCLLLIVVALRRTSDDLAADPLTTPNTNPIAIEVAQANQPTVATPIQNQFNLEFSVDDFTFSHTSGDLATSYHYQGQGDYHSYRVVLADPANQVKGQATGSINRQADDVGQWCLIESDLVSDSACRSTPQAIPVWLSGSSFSFDYQDQTFSGQLETDSVLTNSVSRLSALASFLTGFKQANQN